ncbi:MAG: AsmA family protein [Rhodospirillaceae bacterium]|nr:AsmA family protein [Rhodospirillaceae bacterium]
MKRIGIVAGSFASTILAIVLITPSFIDWTEYRDTFESRLEAATGRSVVIDGDVRLSLLPRPALRVAGVRIGNLPEASTDSFVSADAVAANLAFGPLLSGRIQFNSIEVVRPVINAEVLASGRATWSMGESLAKENAARKGGAASTSFNLGIDSLVLIDGKVNYRDVRSNAEYRFDGLNADLRAGAITGPFDLSGEAMLHETKWKFQAAIAAITANRPSAISLLVRAPDAGLTTNLSGQFSLAEGGQMGSGRLSIEGDNAGATALALGLFGDESLPKPMTDAYAVKARLALEDKSVEISEIELGVGGATAEGNGSVSWGDGTRFDLALKLGRLDLNAWLMGEAKPSIRFASAGGLVCARAVCAQSALEQNQFVFPSNTFGSINLKVDLVEWRDQVMRNGVFSATLADSEVTVAAASIQFPGNTSAQFSGFIRSEKGRPVVDLDANTSSRNLRGFLKWMDVEPPVELVPPSRLNTLSVSSRIRGTPDRLELADLSATLDTTRLTGSIVYEPGGIPNIDLNLALTNLDLDSYLPALRESLSRPENQEKSSASREADPFSTFTKLNTFLSAYETQVSVSIESLTAGGRVARGINVDAETGDGIVSIRDVSAADLSGLSVTMAGKAYDFLDLVRIKDAQIRFATANLMKTSRAFDFDVPRLPILAEPITIEVSANGPLRQLTLDLIGEIGALNVSAKGSVLSSNLAPKFKGDISVDHPAYITLMADLGYAPPANSAPVGAVILTTKLDGGGQFLKLSDLVMKAGDNSVSGQIGVSLERTRPSLSGTVNIVSIDFDSLFPADPTEELTRASRARSTSGSGAVSGRWSSEHFNLASLNSFDATLDVTASRITAQTVVVEQLVAPVQLVGGVLAIERWQGNVYGGPAAGTVYLSVDQRLDLRTSLKVESAMLGRMSNSEGAASALSGQVSLQGNFAAHGLSQRELVLNLSGAGTLTATGIDVGGTGKKAFASDLLSSIRALSQLGGLLSADVTKGLADMTVSFVGEAGVFKLSNASVKSNAYSGTFEGIVDLARWWVDTKGKAHLEANMLTQLLGNRLQLPSLIPVTVTGPLNAPNVNMDTSGGVVNQ